MRKFVLSTLTLIISLMPYLSADADQNEAILRQASKGFSKVAKKAIPAVVYIESEVTKDDATLFPKRSKRSSKDNPFDSFQDEFFNRFFGYPNEEESRPKKSDAVRGSGLIVSKDGYIMTNNHVVDNATKIQVTLHSGKKAIAKLIGQDPKTDLAVIKIEEKDLPFLTFGNSDALEVGDWVIAVGNPFGLEASVTVGIVSAKGRNQLNITDFEDFIQTDAAINPGNSGGPLLNIDGEVIGINTAIVSGSGGYMGIGFAIPSKMAEHIKEQLIKDGSVTRGFLGVTLQPLDSDLAAFYKLESTHGALVTDVVKDSPAAQAGLQQEDIIVSFNNNPVENLGSFRNCVSLMTPGSDLILKIYREGKVKTLNVKVAHVPSPLTATHAPANKLGIQVQNLTPDVAEQYHYTGEHGVVVTSVRPGSSAGLANIRPGNLIVAVNRKKVANVDEFNAALIQASHERTVLLMVRHGEVVRFVALQFE